MAVSEEKSTPLPVNIFEGLDTIVTKEPSCNTDDLTCS